MPADEEGPWLLLIEGIAVVLLVYIEKSRALGVYIMGYILWGIYDGVYIIKTTRGVNSSSRVDPLSRVYIMRFLLWVLYYEDDKGGHRIPGYCRA